MKNAGWIAGGFALVLTLGLCYLQLRLPEAPPFPLLPTPSLPTAPPLPDPTSFAGDAARFVPSGYVPCDEHEAEYQLDFVLTVDSAFRERRDVFYLRKSKTVLDAVPLTSHSQYADGLPFSGGRAYYGVSTLLNVGELSATLKTTCYWSTEEGKGRKEINIEVPLFRDTSGEGPGYSYRCEWRKANRA